MGRVKTFTGRYINPLAPEPDVSAICLDDVAHPLAQKPRFNGHLAVHYSIAEHSVRVAALLRASGAAPDVVLSGLLHDVGEAYLPDLPSPIKDQVFLQLDPDVNGAVELVLFRVQERRLRRAIFAHLGLGDLIDPDDCPSIRHADAAFCEAEADDMLGGLSDLLDPGDLPDILRGDAAIHLYGAADRSSAPHTPARHVGAIRPLGPEVAETAFLLWYERARAQFDQQPAAGLIDGGAA